MLIGTHDIKTGPPRLSPPKTLPPPLSLSRSLALALSRSHVPPVRSTTFCSPLPTASSASLSVCSSFLCSPTDFIFGLGFRLSEYASSSLGCRILGSEFEIQALNHHATPTWELQSALPCCIVPMPSSPPFPPWQYITLSLSLSLSLSHTHTHTHTHTHIRMGDSWVLPLSRI